MSEARKLMAEVAAPLLYSHRVIGKRCTCGVPVKLPSDAWYAKHMGEVLAVEVDKALGGLTREMAGRLGVTDHGRWVSGWTEVTHD